MSQRALDQSQRRITLEGGLSCHPVESAGAGRQAICDRAARARLGCTLLESRYTTRGFESRGVPDGPLWPYPLARILNPRLFVGTVLMPLILTSYDGFLSSGSGLST